MLCCIPWEWLYMEPLPSTISGHENVKYVPETPLEIQIPSFHTRVIWWNMGANVRIWQVLGNFSPELVA